MKNKIVKVKIQQTFGGSYRIEQLVNVESLRFGSLGCKLAGDYLTATHVQELCEFGGIEVTINAIKQ